MPKPSARPRLLDLCCGAGGASAGYHAAGFQVVGADTIPQPRYPFTFIKDDALTFLERAGHHYDVIVASPPCQRFSATRALPHRDASHYPDLIDPLRTILHSLGKPYVLENVPGASLIDPILLCGEMFGLKVFRHRIFESNRPLAVPFHPPHSGQVAKPGRGHRAGQYGPGSNGHITVAGHMFSRSQGAAAMLIGWMSQAELAQASPPAYTEYIGRQVLEQLT